jgi:YVTN family beta-propeller protein
LNPPSARGTCACRILAAIHPDNTVSVIDVATQKVIDNIKVGKGPNGITFRSAPR